jgi:hypothetical protein
MCLRNDSKPTHHSWGGLYCIVRFSRIARASGSVGVSPDNRTVEGSTPAHSHATKPALGVWPQIGSATHSMCCDADRYPSDMGTRTRTYVIQAFSGVEQDFSRVGPHTSLQYIKMGVKEQKRDMRSCNVGISKDLHLESIPQIARSAAADSAACH